MLNKIQPERVSSLLEISRLVAQPRFERRWSHPTSDFQQATHAFRLLDQRHS